MIQIFVTEVSWLFLLLLTFSNIENIIKLYNLDIREKEVEHMPREKFHTLTEQMFYVLLCLKEECYGMDILDKVPAMTGKRVTVGCGTLYNLLEQFLEAKIIQETKVQGRKRSYILTQKGKEMLEKEYERIQAQAQDYRTIFGEEEAK